MALRILLVDDSSDDRRIARTLLGREAMFAGYSLQFIEARDGEEGLAQFKKERPHLVLADLLMPRMDGAGLVKAIRATSLGRDTPLLVLSGFVRDKGGVEALKRDRRVKMITKPVEARELRQSALDLLDDYKRAHPKVVEEWRRPAEGQEARRRASAPTRPRPRQATPAASTAGRPEIPPLDLTRPVRGTLSTHPLSFLLVRAAAARSTGTLKLVRGKVRKLVFINKGVPIFIDSNLRSETLGSYLVSHGMVDESQLAQALKQARATSKKLGETLIQMGVLDERRVLDALSAQTKIKLARAMIWQDGMFSFLPGDDFCSRVPHCPVDAVDVVLGAQKKMTRAADLNELLGGKLDQALELTEAGEQFKGHIERSFGAANLHRAISGTSLEQLAGPGMDPSTLLVLVDALLVGGLARLRQASGAAEAPAPLVVPVARIAPVRKAFLRTGEAQAAPPPAPLEDVATDDIELFEAGEHVPPIYAEPEDSGVMEVPADLDLELEEPGVEQPAPSPAPPPSGRLRERLLQVYLGIHGKNHYEVLGVEPTASAEEVERAYRGLLETYSSARYGGVLEEDDEDKLIEISLIIEQAHAVLSSVDQRRSYDETLARASAEVEPTTDAYGAELLYQEGHTLLKEHDIDGAVQAFRRAVQENPEQPDYHTYLGWALFLSKGRGNTGSTAARPHIEHALRIAPESVKAHELAGWVERDAGNDAKALDCFSRALKLGPPRLDLFEAVKGLLNKLEDYHELEHQFRRMIFGLRAKDPLKTVPLWVDLAYLYLNKLKQPDNARLALDVALKLAPNDPRVKAALNASGTVQTRQWRQVAEGYRRQLLAEPDNLEPLHDLVQLHRKGARHDQAFVAASVLAQHDMATGEELLLCNEQAPKGLIRQARPPTAEELDRVKHPDDLPALENLMVALDPVMRTIFPVTLEEHGSAEDRGLEGQDFPEPFGTTLRHVAEQLHISLPPLFPTEQLGETMVPLPGGQRMLVGSRLLVTTDEMLIAFAAARALAAVAPGRRHIFGRRGSDLKVAVLGTLSHCRPGMRPPDPDGALAGFREALEQSDLDREELGRLVDLLLAQDSKINLSQWMRAVHCTAARVGLLFCSDIRPALAAIHEETYTAKDLVGFVLGQPYTELRRALGVSVAV